MSARGYIVALGLAAALLAPASASAGQSDAVSCTTVDPGQLGGGGALIAMGLLCLGLAQRRWGPQV